MANILTFEPDRSNHISRLSYDPDSLYLYVTFTNNSSYTYAKVPPTVFAAMTRAPSAGIYFHQVIKRHYQLVQKDKAKV